MCAGLTVVVSTLFRHVARLFSTCGAGEAESGATDLVSALLTETRAMLASTVTRLVHSHRCVPKRRLPSGTLLLRQGNRNSRWLPPYFHTLAGARAWCLFGFRSGP